mgnify:CR=1 FL=1
MIGILNYGSGNIKSLSNALSEINIKHKIVTNYICGEVGLSQKTNPIWKQ